MVQACHVLTRLTRFFESQVGERYAVTVRTKLTAGTMLYAVRRASSKAEGWDDMWAPTPGQAKTLWMVRDGLDNPNVRRARSLFGLGSLGVQRKLEELQELHDPSPSKRKEISVAAAAADTPKKRKMETASLKSLEPVALSAAAQPSSGNATASGEEGMSFGHAAFFDQSAQKRAVQAVIEAFQAQLIKTRDPEVRALLIMTRFMRHPDVRKLRRAIVLGWGWDRKEQLVLESLVQNISTALADTQSARDMGSLRLRQTIMNLLSMPKEARTQRTIARMFGVVSRRALASASARVAEAQVELEGGVDGLDEDATEDQLRARMQQPSLFAPPPIKYGKSLPLSLLQEVDKRWASCRPTANKANTIVVDGKAHPVHWLESPVRVFWYEWIEDDDRFYDSELLVRGLPPGLIDEEVVEAMAPHVPTRVIVFPNKKYAYVTFADKAAAVRALDHAHSANPPLEIDGARLTVTRRPLIGLITFLKRRPAWVKDVCAATCLCLRCYVNKLRWGSLLAFAHWEEVCPPVAELLSEVRARALPFAPSVDKLLDVILCPRQEGASFFDRACCFGTCAKCGWTRAIGDSQPQLTIAGPAGEQEPVFVRYQEYSARPPEHKDGDDVEAQSKAKKTRPVLVRRSSDPRAYLVLFGDTLRAYLQHKFIAVVQTHQMHLLKNVLLDNSIIVDMDFAENYEIVHKFQIQSEYFGHHQVTLFISIVHYRVDGKLHTEAHIGVSGDLAHDTWFVQHFQRALADNLRGRGLQFKHWFFNTDGAASHFKNRFTLFSLFEFLDYADAMAALWETCAPGHGKGPWDGLGAVIKRTLRDLELRFPEEKYMTDPRMVFDVLVEHFQKAEDDVNRLFAGRLIDHVEFYFIPGPEASPEEKKTPAPGVLPPIVRPKNNPLTTPVSGVRAHHCFRAERPLNGGLPVLQVRALSCHCDACQASRWHECAEVERAGNWRPIMMEQHSGASALGVQSKLHNQRALRSAHNRAIAKGLDEGEFLALRSADDEAEAFWIAQATGAATKQKESKERAGVWLTAGHWYVDVQMYRPSSADAKTTFVIDKEPMAEGMDSSYWRVDAEGVVAALGTELEVVEKRFVQDDNGRRHAEVVFQLSAHQLKKIQEGLALELDPNDVA